MTGSKRSRLRHRPLLALLPILCLAIGAAVIVQVPGWNERAHYAQVRALRDGTWKIDPYIFDTGDRGYYQGHWYANKAPGLAMFVLPYYAASRSAGIASSDEPREIHQLAIIGALIPAVILLVLIASFVERIEPGAGTPTALLLGVGSLFLPFSTLLFSHMLSACLGFAAYYLLWLQRHAGWRRTTVVFAGVLAGLGITIEYPQALLALILGAYAIGRPASSRRLVQFGSGVLVGVAPLLAYDWWAFGSPTHISYTSAWMRNVGGVFGLSGFSLHAALDLLFGARGLLTLTPVLAAAVAGIFILRRRGRRGEAAMAAVVGIAYLLYNASYWIPFGGWGPGPRFLIPMLPFLALPLAAALRKAPAATLALGAVSAATMFAATATVPELPSNVSTSVWWQRLGHEVFSAASNVSTHVSWARLSNGALVPENARAEVLWFAALALAAIVLTRLLAGRPRVDRHQIALAGVGIGAWLLVARVGGSLISGHAIGGELALIAIVGAASLLIWRAAERFPWHSADRLVRAGRPS